MASLRAPILNSLIGNNARPMSRDKADTLLLLAACAMVLLPHMSHLPLWISLTFPLVLFWRGWITFRGNRMPPKLILISTTVLTMAGIFFNFKTFFGKDAGVAMLVMLLTFKLLEMHAKRDLFVAVFLSFFLILSNFFYSQTIGTALMMIVAVVTMLAAQLSFQYTGAVPSIWRRLRHALLIFVLAVPLTLVCFFLFPRIQGPLWGLPDDANAGRTGMSDTMAPGNITDLALTDEVAFRVKFIDPPPPQSQLYWRGIVLGNYDGRTWSQLRFNQSSKQPIHVQGHGTPIRHQVTLEPNGRNWLFALELPQTPPTINGIKSLVTHDLQFLSQRPINERVRYDTSTYVDFDIETKETEADLQPLLKLPPGYNPLTRIFATSLQKKISDKKQLVDAVMKFFREEKFSYTLEPPPLGANAVDDFLFTTRAGFCEHYASSFTVVMRMLGIPSRVVTGYQGGEINSADGFMTIRQLDAHAWSEVWLENRGWIRVDPTAAVAPSRVSANLASVIPRGSFGGLLNINLGKNALIGKLTINWEALTNSWNQWVLSYTPEKQKSLLQSIGFENVDWGTLSLLLVVLGTASIAIVAFPMLVHRKKTDPIDSVYASFCRQMEKYGVKRAIHEGPRAYRERLSATTSLPIAAAAARFLHLYETIRYGNSPQAPAANLAELKKLLSAIR